MKNHLFAILFFVSASVCGQISSILQFKTDDALNQVYFSYQNVENPQKTSLVLTRVTQQSKKGLLDTDDMFTATNKEDDFKKLKEVTGVSCDVSTSNTDECKKSIRKAFQYLPNFSSHLFHTGISIGDLMPEKGKEIIVISDSIQYKTNVLDVEKTTDNKKIVKFKTERTSLKNKPIEVQTKSTPFGDIVISVYNQNAVFNGSITLKKDSQWIESMQYTIQATLKLEVDAPKDLLEKIKSQIPNEKKLDLSAEIVNTWN